MFLHTIQVSPLGSNCVLLGADDDKDAVVVDPGGEAKRIIAALEQRGRRASAILLTHAHIDHVAGAMELASASGAAIYLHPDDELLFEKAGQQAAMFGLPQPEPGKVDHRLEHRQKLQLAGLQIEVRHTPGHSPGSVCFVLSDEELCLSGDTLFAGGIGRYDLWGGSLEALERSIREQLYTLPDETRVIAGHGPETTIGEEKRTNPFLRG